MKLSLHFSRAVMRRRWFAVSALTALALAGCGTGASTPNDAATNDTLTVVTSTYPLEFVLEQIGGEHVEVINVVPVGADPHDVELTPQDVSEIYAADLVVYASGFQSALDAAAKDAPRQLDLADDLDLLPAGSDLDPHFWLDPLRLDTAATLIADALTTADEPHTAEYSANAAVLFDDLAQLDERYRTELAECTTRTFLTTHAAFGYLADRYDLVEESITGIDPEGEPSPAQLTAAAEVVAAHDLPVVFAEPGAPAKAAEVLARDLDIEVATLDPLEVSDLNTDYLTTMAENLEALKAGLQCHQ